MPTPGQIVIATDLLTAGIRADFWDVYEPMYDGLKAKLSDYMDLDVPSDKLTEIYAYAQSAAYPGRWKRGEEIPSKAFKGVQFSVTNKDWGIRIPWHENDRQDDQTKSIRQRAQSAGKNFATLDERVFYQILRGAVDTELLESIPNAPDGVALYSATDGDGAARFGVSGGNIITGTGVATPGAIQTDLFSALSRVRSFLDTEGQPLHDMSLIDQGVSITFNVNNWKVFAEAFQQGRTHSVISSTGAAVTNIIMDSGLRVDLTPTTRITDNDWFVFLRGVPHKPIFRQTRQPIREWFATMENSDSARDTKIEYAEWEARYGYGVMLPFATVQVNN